MLSIASQFVADLTLAQQAFLGWSLLTGSVLLTLFGWAQWVRSWRGW